MASDDIGILKSGKKIQKKINRLKERLRSHDKIISTDEPSKLLCICNGGLDNSVTYEEVLSLFGQYGSRCDVIMVPQKSYAFVCLETGEEGLNAANAVNGHILSANGHRKTDVTLYVLFVKEVPESISPTRELPPGLILLEDFVSEEYAVKILKSVNWEDLSNPCQQQQLKHRRVKHYGYEFKYSINNVDPDDPLSEGVPDIYRPLLERLLDQGVIRHYPDQLTINQYQPGQGIPPHVDTPEAFEDGLVSLSLGSQVVMEFRHPDSRHLSVLLPPRSVLVMTKESRYVWSHGITPRKSDIITLPDGGLTLSQRGIRTSFTFRKLTGARRPKQNSDKPELPCDDQTAAQLEKVHVYQVYEEIADHFSGTRHTPWPNITEFLKEQPQGSLLADIGCGNGKYFGINKGLFEIGSDRSHNLAKIVRERNFQVYVGDVLSVPLRESIFDVCLCIAVIHHLSTWERRQRAVSELLKILRPGGKALIYVWAMEQELNDVKSKYLKKSEQSSTEQHSVSGEMLISDQSKGTDLGINTLNGAESQGVTSLNKQFSDLNQEESEDNLKDVDDNISTKLKETGSIEEAKETNRDKISCCAFEQNSALTGQQTEEMVESLEDNNTDFDSTKNKIEAKSEPQKLEFHVNRTHFKQQDLLVPWQLKGKDKKQMERCEQGNTFHRFYHVFKEGELESLCQGISGCRLVKSYYDQGNWAVVLEKL